MPSDPQSNDPMLREIAKLRIDVNHLIDEQITFVKGWAEELAPPRGLRTAPAPNVPEPPDETAKGRAADPRQRLDALAKHLDHRLRLANVPSTERPERSPSPEG